MKFHVALQNDSVKAELGTAKRIRRQTRRRLEKNAMRGCTEH
jgi:hypothetical protein